LTATDAIAVTIPAPGEMGKTTGHRVGRRRDNAAFLFAERISIY
jgi:hypothetical protein